MNIKKQVSLHYQGLQAQNDLLVNVIVLKIIYNLFGEATWGNFYRLGMFNLPSLKQLLYQRKTGGVFNEEEHRQIISTLKYVSNQFEIEIPKHWL